MRIRSQLAGLRRRVGHRGRALLYFGMVNAIYAIGLFTAPDDANATFRWFASIAPLESWAALWLGSGLAAWYHAFHRHDRFGFVALMGVYVVWSIGCLAGWVTDDITLGAVGIWAGLVFLVHDISSWAEPIEDMVDDA